VSNALVAQGPLDLPNDRRLSAMVYAFGQFLDHDISLTPKANPTESFPIGVPTGDPEFDPQATGTAIIPFSRSRFDANSGTSTANPRRQINAVTAFIDGSQIYGSDLARANALRTFVGGKLKTSPGDLLPFNTLGFENQIPAGANPEDFFLAGDIRVNENVELTALHTLFVREHNRLADRIAARRPTWSDERLYQTARRYVIAELQAITYGEFLPALLGGNALTPYQGYQSDVNPGINNEFATAAFRLGHSMLGPDVEFLDNSGQPVRSEIPLRDAFFAPGIVQSEGIATILKYLASDPAQEIDIRVVDEVRNFLFGPPGAGGFDLASLNIQRGRDHGLDDYAALRIAYGLSPAMNFNDITDNVDLQLALANTYGSIDDIDVWVGGLAEDHAAGGSVGPLFRAIIADQFQRLRDGDRFWYEDSLTPSQVPHYRSMTLAKVIRNNSATKNLQPNVFEFYTEISGRLALDVNYDGAVQAVEPGLMGYTIQLLDVSDQVVASLTTETEGRYQFTGLGFGTYRVRPVLPFGLRLNTPLPADVVIDSPISVGPLDFGLVPILSPIPFSASLGVSSDLASAV
jgi:hypothetical protein